MPTCSGSHWLSARYKMKHQKKKTPTSSSSPPKRPAHEKRTKPHPDVTHSYSQFSPLTIHFCCMLVGRLRRLCEGHLHMASTPLRAPPEDCTRSAYVIGISLRFFHPDAENCTQQFRPSLSVIDTVLIAGLHAACSTNIRTLGEKAGREAVHYTSLGRDGHKRL